MKDPDLLIVGLGPAGAILANFCGRLGMSVKIVEREKDIYSLPRAIVMDFEVLRQLNLIGCADDFLSFSQKSRDYEFINANREILTYRKSPTEKMPTGYYSGNLFHQPSMERAVRAKLVDMPNVEICLGVDLIAIDQDDESARAVLRTDEGLVEQRAKIIVGADGGRSLMRRYLDIQMEDLGFDEPWVVVDVEILDEDNGLSKNGIQLCDPRRPTTCVPSGPGRHRWEFMLHPHETAQDVTKAENLTKWISEWVDPSKVKVERSAVYQFHGLVAKKWRVGRAMIIGDAAHQMPPFMGQGLCAGARDAANLAWKIAAVSRGEAPLEFLDTVEQERSPHVKAVTKGAIEMGKVVCVLDEDEAAARDRKMMEDHKAGRGFAFPSVPYIENGVLSDATAGHVFPEPFTGSIDTPVRVDDEVGIVPLLVLKDTENLSVADRSAIAALQLASPNLKIVTLGGEIPESIKALDADGHVAHLMDNAPAMLVKPDRIIFGSAAVPVLALAWRNYLQGEDVLVQEKEIAA